MRRAAVWAAAAMAFGVAWAGSAAYQAQIAEWRRAREQALKADGGWLTVTGLFWLHDGANSFGSASSNEIVLPRDPELRGSGVFELRNGKVTMRLDGRSRELRANGAGSSDIVTLGSLTLFVIRRGDRYGIRLKDKNSRFRKEFTGLGYFPADKSYRVSAHFVARAPAAWLRTPTEIIGHSMYVYRIKDQ